MAVLRRPRVRVRPIFSINRLIPNIVTLLALCAGMTAIRFAVNGNFPAAAISIIVAAVLDGIDGRVARLLKATTNFGAQLDSLSDFISFGVAPAIILYAWTMSQWHGFGWALVLIYSVCNALRLARFNTQLGIEPPPYAYNFFVGVPAPAAAGLVLIPMMFTFELGSDFIFRSPYLNGFVLAGVAALMVSRVPTFSFKRFRIHRDLVVPVLLVVGALAAFLTTEPWATLLAAGLIYLGSIPLSIRSYRLRRAADERRNAPSPAPAIEATPMPPPD